MVDEKPWKAFFWADVCPEACLMILCNMCGWLTFKKWSVDENHMLLAECFVQLMNHFFWAHCSVRELVGKVLVLNPKLSWKPDSNFILFLDSKKKLFVGWVKLANGKLFFMLCSMAYLVDFRRLILSRLIAGVSVSTEAGFSGGKDKTPKTWRRRHVFGSSHGYIILP